MLVDLVSVVDILLQFNWHHTSQPMHALHWRDPTISSALSTALAFVDRNSAEDRHTWAELKLESYTFSSDAGGDNLTGSTKSVTTSVSLVITICIPRAGP